MNCIIPIVLLLLFTFVIVYKLFWYEQNKPYVRNNNVSEHFRVIFPGKSKCFDCEIDLAQRYGMDAAYMGRPTRSFDAENHAMRMWGGIGAIQGQPSRLYSADFQFLNSY
jgi:hypothetical protein